MNATEHFDRVESQFTKLTAYCEESEEWDAIRIGLESLTALRATLATEARARDGRT